MQNGWTEKLEQYAVQASFFELSNFCETLFVNLS